VLHPCKILIFLRLFLSKTHTHTYKDTHTQPYKHTHTKTHTHPYKHTHTNTHTHTHARTHAYKDTHTYVYAYKLIYTRIQTLSLSHTHTLSLSLSHTHTHTHNSLTLIQSEREMPNSKAVSNKDVLIPIATFMNESNKKIIATWPKMMICFQTRDFNNYFS